MAALKPALVLPPAEELTGDVAVAEIGIPVDELELEGPALHLTDLEEIEIWSEALHRAVASHKGDSGRVLIVAGSVGKQGAGALCALGALRGGAGLVTLAVPSRIWASVAPGVPEVMVEPVGGETDGYLGKGALDRLVELARHADIVAIGPGLGREETTADVVVSFLEAFRGPRIVDADGLWALGRAAHDGKILEGIPDAPLFLTPHPGEMAWLLATGRDEVQADRLQAARSCASRHQAHVVLKGYRSVSACPSGELWINPTGGPALATAGTGDVLTGLAAAFAAQGVAPEEVLPLAAFLHGLAGDAIDAEQGPIGLLATDLLDELPSMIGAALEGWDEELDEETDD